MLDSRYSIFETKCIEFIYIWLQSSPYHVVRMIVTDQIVKILRDNWK